MSPSVELGNDHLVPTRIDDGPWRDVTVGSEWMCAVRENGTLWCTGRNEHGQLGAADEEDRSVLTRVCIP